jgi:hypothetical protein
MSERIMFMSLYCPHIKDCGFYHNWLKYIESAKIDVIFSEEGKENLRYDCLALRDLNEMRINMDAELKSKLLNPEQQVTCSHITLLNLLAK